jgi:tRNA A64-2'-O-ribosylphosphate transferase
MNLQFLTTATSASRHNCATLIVDASKSKVFPDSFSRTLPIWCSVLNRLALAYRKEGAVNDDSTFDWDSGLYTPPSISEEEHDVMMNLLPDRVNSALESGVILNPAWLVRILRKPLRCFWIANEGVENLEDNLNDFYSKVKTEIRDYTCILCISCSYLSTPIESSTEQTQFLYTPGAADDHESWSNGLNPYLFWMYKERILGETNSPDETDQLIEIIIEMSRNKDDELHLKSSVLQPSQMRCGSFDTIEGCGISIGTRRAGRPPECWTHFDAIINVTTMEYEGMKSGNEIPTGCHYLNIPVREGKRDRTDLEKWMAVALFFIGFYASKGKRVLVHCAQGKDRSVAVSMAAISLFCQIIPATDEHDSSRNALKFHVWCHRMNMKGLNGFLMKNYGSSYNGMSVKPELYLQSGIPKVLVHNLLGREGRNSLLSWIRSLSLSTTSKDEVLPHHFATKESLRLTLLLIQQYRHEASPTRNTMQKLNRFFMSSDKE